MYITGKPFCSNSLMSRFMKAQGKTTFENEYMKVPTKRSYLH